MLRFANVATPLTAATVSVPDRVPLAGLAPIATVIDPVKPGTTLFEASSADTRTVAIVVPAWVLVGWVEKIRWVAGGAVMLKWPLVAPARPEVPAVNV